jgi:predicted metal-dependent hydrolase
MRNLNSKNLKDRAEMWAKRLRVTPRCIRVQSMKRKWGSCSTLGTVTLASDLIRCAELFQDFVIVHELVHLRVPNHGRLFKSLLTVHIPQWRRLSVERDSQ